LERFGGVLAMARATALVLVLVEGLGSVDVAAHFGLAGSAVEGGSEDEEVCMSDDSELAVLEASREDTLGEISGDERLDLAVDGVIDLDHVIRQGT